MSLNESIAKFVAADIRYGITIVSTFLLGLALLFFKDFPDYYRSSLIPGLIVYTIGTGLLAHIQVVITASTNTKAKADGGAVRGINEASLRNINICHVVWFVAFIGYLVYRNIYYS